MNSKLLFTLFAMTSVIYVHSDEVKEKQPTSEHELARVYVYKEDPELTTFILTSFLRCQKKDDLLNYVNKHSEISSEEKTINGETSYIVDQIFEKYKQGIAIDSIFEEEISGPDAALKANSIKTKVFVKNDHGIIPPEDVATIRDRCSECVFITLCNRIKHKYKLVAKCKTKLDLNKPEDEKLIEEIGKKVAAEKEQAKEKNTQPLNVPFRLKLND